ncbi:alpha/beta hydrolase [Winogradskyella helgolandensis]|uniref:alpha/beta hydrolase n=1 Tax=Winogradskyella helgolandensis TaxID=2697010 RepID=UPI0015CA1C9E|nr:alpha/beta fold hydrolase [Winogradskyella helgolandensis]
MTKNRIAKILKRTFIILFVVGLLIFYFIYPRLITERRNPIIEIFKTQKVISSTLEQNDNSKFKRKKLTITTYDGLKQYAILTYSSLAKPKGTIILLHGSSHTKEHFLDLSEFLSINGFNSVALDIRGFGESEGQFFTYGIKESKDIQKLIDDLINEEGLSNIGIWGQSIGGALVLQTMGVDQRIKYGISESAYTDLKSNIQGFFQRHTGYNLALISDFLVDRAGSVGDFDADDASPIKYAKSVTQPILVIHGDKDIAINISEGKANFSNIKSNDKEFIEVESAGHSDLWEVGGDKYFNQVLTFLNNNSTK